jgi:hypothetical protein
MAWLVVWPFSTYTQSMQVFGVAADEGMTCGPSIFAYLVFGPGRASNEGTSRPTRNGLARPKSKA